MRSIVTLVFVIAIFAMCWVDAMFPNRVEKKIITQNDSILLELRQYNKNLEDIKVFIFKDGSLFLDRSRIKVGHNNYLYYKPGGQEDGK